MESEQKQLRELCKLFSLVVAMLIFAASAAIVNATGVMAYDYFWGNKETVIDDITPYPNVPVNTPNPDYYDNGYQYNDVPDTGGVTINEPGYGNDWPLETPGHYDKSDAPIFANPKEPARYKDGKTAPEEVRNKKMPFRDNSYKKEWRYEPDYKNNRPFSRGYYDEFGNLRIRDDFTDHGYPEKDYPGHRHLYDPVDPRDPSKGVKERIGKEPIPQRKLP